MACLVADAIGPQNLTTVAMPTNGLIRKDQPDSLHALLSYVCGFQSAMLRKVIKKQYIEIFTKNKHGVSEISGLNKILSLFTHFHFLNLEHPKLRDLIFGDNDIVSINDSKFKDLNLTQMMVLWHRVYNISKRITESDLFKVYFNLSKFVMEFRPILLVMMI